MLHSHHVRYSHVKLKMLSMPSYACWASSALSGWFSLCWLSRGMYCAMIAMISESMYRCNTRWRVHGQEERENLMFLPGFGKRSFGPYPEPELVEQVSGDAGAGDARQDQCGDEPPERRHVLGWTLKAEY